MTQFATSLRFVDVSVVVDLLVSLASTGRLQITRTGWTATLMLRRGQIVAASLGTETGMPALEGLVIGILEGDLSYADEPVSDAEDILVSADQRANYLNQLTAERRHVLEVIPSLGLVPALVESPDSRVTVSATALRFIPNLLSGRTLDQLAREHGMARSVRAVAALVEAGLVKLEPLRAAEVVAPVHPPQPPPRLERLPLPPAPPLAAVPPVARTDAAAPPAAPEPRPTAGRLRAVKRFFGFDESADDGPRPAPDSTESPSVQTLSHPSSGTGVLGAVARFFGFDETEDLAHQSLDRAGKGGVYMR